MTTCVNAANGGNGMGIGKLGEDYIIHKRKFRWLFTIQTCNGQIPPYFVKTAARPDITIEDTEINFLNEKTWIPGKATWEPINVTYYDIATDDNIDLWGWLASVYDFTSDCRHMNSRRSSYAGVGILVLLDGCGNRLEKWVFGDMWPTSVKFGDLSYADNETVDIELTLRYSKVSYHTYCGRSVSRCPCTACTSGNSVTTPGKNGSGTTPIVFEQVITSR